MYTFRYRMLVRPEGRKDGSGGLMHQIEVFYSEDGEDMGTVGRHKTISIPGDEMQAILAMPHSPGVERQAKIAAYKDALVSNLNQQPKGVTGWSAEQMTEYLDGNKLSVEISIGAIDFIENVLNQEFPVEFSL